MDRDVLNSPASLNYRTRCSVNTTKQNVTRPTKTSGSYHPLKLIGPSEKIDGNGYVTYAICK